MQPASSVYSTETRSLKDESPAARAPALVQASPMSLPSFAAFNESTQNHVARISQSYTDAFAVGAGDGSTKQCSCAELTPMIQTASDAARKLGLALRRHVLELEEHRLLDQATGRSPPQVLQQVIDQLVSAELSLSRHGEAPRRSSLCTACKSSLDTEQSSLQHKRSAAGYIDAVEIKRLKYDRRSPPLPDVRRASSSSSTLRPIEVGQQMARSSAHSIRLLPSPSSIVHTETGYAPASRIGNSPSPPPTSHNTSSSLHNVSTTSAASQHIANLEHQLTLKSLSLQSLQAEHTNLLQKWHRERVKTQAIEKKCIASDSEINDLAARNDELLEQVKGLELQLASAEQRRDQQTQLTTQEKDQWGRMLEMSGRLQQKAQQDCQRLQEENARLIKTLTSVDVVYASGREQSVEEINKGHEEMPQEIDIAPKPSDQHRHHSAEVAMGIISSLNIRVSNLRVALERAQRQGEEVAQKCRDVDEQRQILAGIIARALNVEGMAEEPPQKHTEQSTSLEQAPHANTQLVASTKPSILLEQQDPGSADVESPFAKRRPERSSGAATIEALLAAGSGRSIPEADLGFEVIPTSSSPEDLLRALGPAPPVTA